jgi:hypothetical protein
MSVAPGHADAAYVALPQAPDAAYAGHPSVPTGLDGENDMEDMPLHAGRPLRLDSRVRWILFMLGSAVLLPWNGELMSRTVGTGALKRPRCCSHDHRDSLFPVATFRHTSSTVLVVHLHHLHCGQLCLPCAGNSNLQTGSSCFAQEFRSADTMVRPRTSSALV